MGGVRCAVAHLARVRPHDQAMGNLAHNRAAGFVERLTSRGPDLAPRVHESDGDMNIMRQQTPVDRDEVLAKLGDDEQLFAMAIAIFLEDCPGRLTQIRSALDKGEPQAIRASAHALRGAAGILAAHELFDATRTIEDFGGDGRIDCARAAWPRLAKAAQDVMDVLRQFAETGARSG